MLARIPIVQPDWPSLLHSLIWQAFCYFRSTSRLNPQSSWFLGFSALFQKNQLMSVKKRIVGCYLALTQQWSRGVLRLGCPGFSLSRRPSFHVPLISPTQHKWRGCGRKGIQHRNLCQPQHVKQSSSRNSQENVHCAVTSPVRGFGVFEKYFPCLVFALARFKIQGNTAIESMSLYVEMLSLD